MPPGDTSQLTTDIGSFLSTPLRETSGTALTEPRAHSRIHCIARSVAFSLLAANRTFYAYQPLCGDWCCLDGLNLRPLKLMVNRKLEVNLNYFLEVKKMKHLGFIF
ncbi:TPA: hypothetical protein RST05_002637 [Klebsiella pneumoniae]|nr:hypothetical protein [Klebsiella pneumoniae]